jgi:hypothetical protein
MTKLSVFERTIPLRAIPEKDLNTALVMDFVPWLSERLSLKGQTSADRLEIALPAIKEQCIGMGFVEIKKMFMMYIDGKFDIEPKTNFFDRILFGKIVAEYRKYNMRKPKQKQPQIPQISDQEKKEIDDQILKDQESYFKKHRVIDPSKWYAYDILDSRGLINLSLEEKKEIYADALEILKLEAHTKKSSSREDYQKNKNLLELLNQGKGAKIKAKELSLQQYYQNKFKK